MATKNSGKKLYHADREVRILNPIITITGSTGAITAVSGMGIRSGSTGAAGVHTIHLGQSGSASSVSNDKYGGGLLGAVFQVMPNVSASSYTPPYAARLQERDVNGVLASAIQIASGTVIFTTNILSGNATTGAETEIVGAPTRDIRIHGVLFLKNSDA